MILRSISYKNLLGVLQILISQVQLLVVISKSPLPFLYCFEGFFCDISSYVIRWGKLCLDVWRHSEFHEALEVVTQQLSEPVGSFKKFPYNVDTGLSDLSVFLTQLTHQKRKGIFNVLFGISKLRKTVKRTTPTARNEKITCSSSSALSTVSGLERAVQMLLVVLPV